MKIAWIKENFVSLATLFFLFAGTVIAGWALNVYINQTRELNKQNKIQLDLSLRSAENAMYEMTSKDEYLMAFFADPPTKGNFSLVDAQRYVDLFLRKGSRFGGWKNVEELLSKLYEPDDNYHDPKKNRLRKAYDLAEHLLYLLQDAHSAREAEILSPEEYETWITYVDDIGFNPLFLSALYFGHSSGYITKKFANHIKERLIVSKRSKQAVSILYKELLQDDWIYKLGKRGYDDHDHMKTSSNKSMQRIANKYGSR